MLEEIRNKQALEVNCDPMIQGHLIPMCEYRGNKMTYKTHSSFLFLVTYTKVEITKLKTNEV